MKKFNNWLSLAIIITLISCGKPLPTLDSFDKETWVKDRNACNNQRSGIAQTLTSQREKLLGLSETEIVQLLGKPDRNELYKRNQKFFYYFLEPSADCKNNNSPENPKKLTIRFNAVGLAKEILFD